MLDSLHRQSFGQFDWPRRFRVPAQYLAACASLGTLTYIATVLRANLTTASLLDLLLVVIVAWLCGFPQASVTSLLAVGCLDYFFVPPLYRFNIDNPQDWVSLGVFEITALVVSRLSARELRNAREAGIHRKGMEQLYELSRSSLLLDLRQAPGPQLVVLIQRIFGLHAVALYDANLGRLDRMGEWEIGEEELAKQCYLRDASQDETNTETLQRVLRASHGPVGALVARGELSPLVVDALAALAAIALDRHKSFENEERSENARQSEQLRSAVLDALAHDFKTPLSSILVASAGLLETGGLAGSQRDLTVLIEREALRLNDLCSRLLQTARLESRDVAPQRESVNVRDLILEVLTGQEMSKGRDRMRVAVEDPTLTAQLDRELFAMILRQYVDNARKYSNPGTPIEIAAEKSRTELLISVHNFGSAIRMEDRERIFERFYRSPDSREAVPGTGIGLSAVRKAAEAHRGHVWVVSDEKEGTTFFLSIPNGAKGKNLG